MESQYIPHFEGLEKNIKVVSPLYLEWNTLESMVINWNQVFETIN